MKNAKKMENDALYVLDLGLSQGFPWTRTGVCRYEEPPVDFHDERLVFLVRTPDADEVFNLFRKVHDMDIAHGTATVADAGMSAEFASSGVLTCCKPNGLGYRDGKGYTVMIDRVPVRAVGLRQ